MIRVVSIAVGENLMIDMIIVSCAALVCQMAILRLWLSSELTYPLVDWLLKRKERTTRRNPLWYVYSVLTCWQCLGVWVSLALTFYFAYLQLGGFKLSFVPALFCLSLGISLVSEYLNYKYLSQLPTYTEEDNNAAGMSDGLESASEVNTEGTEEAVSEGDGMQTAETESNRNDDMGYHEG